MSKKKNIIGNWYENNCGICKILRKYDGDLTDYGDIIVLKIQKIYDETSINTYQDFADFFDSKYDSRYGSYRQITPAKAKTRLLEMIPEIKDIFEI